MITVRLKESLKFLTVKLNWGDGGEGLKRKKKKKSLFVPSPLCFSLLLSPSGWRGTMTTRRRRPARGGAGRARRGWWARRARSPAHSRTVWSWPTATGDTSRKTPVLSVANTESAAADCRLFWSSWREEGRGATGKRENRKCQCKSWRGCTSSINNQYKSLFLCEKMSGQLRRMPPKVVSQPLL